jgi:hypothetical protein
MNLRNLTTGLAALAFLASACVINSTEDDDGGAAGSGGTTQTGDMVSLSASFTGLEALGDGYLYEGWLIVDGAPVTTGRFNIDPSQTVYDFDVARADAEAATNFVLTIEPAEGDDPAPSHVHVLGGDLANASAELAVGHGAALGTDFADMAGSYIFMTPSSAEAADHDQGIWYLMDVSGEMQPSLTTLPVLPEGWEYEGWVVGDDGPISTGKFTSADGEDSDGAGATAGTEGTPPFPGQDFIDPAVVLTDYTIVVSVEPVPDDSTAPFALKPLIDPTAEDLGPGVSQDMTNMADTLPTGSVDLML